MNNFHYVAVLLDMLYGVLIEDEDLEEIGLVAWNLIGNKNTKLYRYSTCISKDNSIQLPCNVSSVEAVTAQYEDVHSTSPYYDNGDNYLDYVENSIESEKYFKSPYYLPGKLLKYELVGDTLYFSRNYGKVNVLYKGILADEDGLPELSDKEALAIATYIAWMQKYKEGLVTNNGNIILLAATLKQQWLQQCDQARVTRLSENDMNEILEVKNTFNRTAYGLSFKYRP